MISQGDFETFRLAVDHAHLPIIEHLLSHPTVLAYAEIHQEYEGFVHPYVMQQLADLHQQSSALEETHPNAVFDVDLTRAQRGFYILRNLIRRNDPALLDEIRFLLNIPGIKNLAHTAVTPHQANELLRLAVSISNTSAAQILLNIPAVRAEARRNGYYQDMVRGGEDLAALAQDRESSMTALSTGEQKRLQAATDKYNPTLQQPGMVANLMTVLTELLKERFEEKPATIEIERDGLKSQVPLPLLWEDFIKLDLNAEEKDRAYKAYYKHKDHTAWRYLSKPNHWMHPHAGYVYISEDRRERWATFEEYQPLIALLFLAAKDDTIPATDGYSLDTRLEHFISELALIGRAHNWDKIRFIEDEEGNQQSEEYDDLEGDRPSCFSGVKRRLFQSVQGHPLLKVLTKDLLREEIREFVRQHFIRVIPLNNPQQLLAAWNQLVEGEQDAIAILKVLDVSPIQQTQCFEQLVQKYGPQLSEDSDLRKYFRDAFDFKKPDYDCHVVYFGYGDMAFEELLQSAIEQQEYKAEPGSRAEDRPFFARTGTEDVGGYFKWCSII